MAVDGFHRTQKGCFLVKRITAVRTKCGGDAQNFIFDKNFLESIVRDCGITKDTTVVEIGDETINSASLSKYINKFAEQEIENDMEKNTK